MYAVSNERAVIAISKSNLENALYFIKVKDENNCSVTPVNLNMESAGRITMLPSDAWSTPFLPMAECLFNPQIHAGNNNETVIVANAVDGSARIFITGSEVKEKSKIDHCFEPCFVNIAEKKMIFARKSPKARWFSCYGC